LSDLVNIIRFFECAFQIEVSSIINRRTPKMDNRIYSSTVRNLDTRYNLLPHLFPRWKAPQGMGLCMFFRVIIYLKWRVSFYTTHCLEVQNYGRVGRALYFNKLLNF